MSDFNLNSDISFREIVKCLTFTPFISEESIYPDWRTQPQQDYAGGSGRWSQEARQKFQSDLEAAQAAKRRARQAEYDTANEEDVNPKMDFRLEFNQEDPELWFATLECNMQTRGIKSQLSKKAVLVANLPAKVQTVCRPCLTNPSRDTPYKELKTRILKHYRPTLPWQRRSLSDWKVGHRNWHESY